MSFYTVQMGSLIQDAPSPLRFYYRKTMSEQTDWGEGVSEDSRSNPLPCEHVIFKK